MVLSHGASSTATTSHAPNFVEALNGTLNDTTSEDRQIVLCNFTYDDVLRPSIWLQHWLAEVGFGRGREKGGREVEKLTKN